MADNTVIVADGYRSNERIRYVHQDTPEIIRCRKVRHERCIGQDGIISCGNIIAGILKCKPYVASAAKDMNDPPGISQSIKFLPCIGKNNSVKPCVVHNLSSVLCESNQKPRIVKISPRIMQ